MKHPAIRIEGAILNPEILERLNRDDAVGQRPADFGLPSGVRVKDEIVRAWAHAQNYWRAFQDAFGRLPSEASATSDTRQLWMLPFLRLLGYDLEYSPRGELLNGKNYPISHRLLRRDGLPIHLLGAHDSLDRKRAAEGGPRMSPHALVQEYLNLTEHVYGLVSNGRQLRLLRDSTRLIRLSYIEFDLSRIFDEQLFADFALLYRLLHASRLPHSQITAAQSIIERYHQDAIDAGARIRDGLRDAVEGALLAFGNGLLTHAKNDVLRAAFTDHQLSERSFYQYLLRLIYRLLFLMVIEERRLVFPAGVPVDKVRVYFDGYSIQRLRRLAGQRAARDPRHGDLWLNLRSTFALFENEAVAAGLGLAPLAGTLFATDALGPLDAANLDNATLLAALDRLCTFEHPDTHQRTGVNYGALATEEFGSVYESLLELHPVIHFGPLLRFSFKEAAGNERKTTGSYYTPSSLVECLLDSALDPVLDDCLDGKKGADAEQAILSLKVCDPACGSGHFLIAAAQRIARRLAVLRAGDEEPSPDQFRHALRQVISRCLYGVDINPMAVELCKVTLWLEATEPGKPLSFLDHHIQCGNSLLGVTPRLLDEGLPDDAFKPIADDDKAVCTEAKKRNKDERKQLALFHGSTQVAPWLHLGNLPAAMLEVDTMSDDTTADLHRKEERYAELVRSATYESARFLADAWCAAFVWKKTRDFGYPITNDVLRKIERNPRGACDPWMREEIERLRDQYQFFHWHLAFPEVFPIPTKSGIVENKFAGWSGGFDVMLGNPPWERVKLQEKEWFAERRPEIAEAPNSATRRRLIEKLATDDPTLYTAFGNAVRQAEGESHLMRSGQLFPLCARGDVNLYAVFAEAMRQHLASAGRMGAVLPSGVATDDTTKLFFQAVCDTQSLISLFDFENREGLFPAVDSRMKFCLFTSGSGTIPVTEAAEFVFFAHNIDQLRDVERRFTLSTDDIALLNPNTRTCPIFRSRRDAEITKRVYRYIPVLLRDGDPQNPWAIRFGTMFHMANDSDCFRTRVSLERDGWQLIGNIFHRNGDAYLPLYEAKMTAPYDHRAADVVLSETALVRQGQSDTLDVTEHADPTRIPMPRYWVPQSRVSESVGGSARMFLIGFTDVTSPTNERTMLATVMPLIGVGHTKPLIFSSATATVLACMVGNLNSFAFDYFSRQKIGGIHFTYFYLKQLPVFPPAIYAAPCKWAGHSALLRDWMLPRVLELSYTAWDLEPFARDCGWFGPPFIWNEERRFQLRCELDAAFLHLYDLSFEDADYILDAFPIVCRKDKERATRFEGQPRYITKETILSLYKKVRQCIDTGDTFHSALAIPPADPRASHEPRVPSVPRASLPGREYFEIVLPLLLSMNPSGLERTRLFHAITVLTDSARRRSDALRELGSKGKEWSEAFREHYDWLDAGEALLFEMRKGRICGVDRLRLASDAALTTSNPWLCLDAYMALRLAVAAEPAVARQSEAAQQPWADKIIQLQLAA